MKKTCGVNSNLYRVYDFKDHTWFQNNIVDLLYLTNRCVKVGNSYWFKKVGGDHWIPITSIVDAEKESINTWLGGKLPSGTIVSQDLIATYFSGIEWQQGNSVKSKPIPVKVGSCPNISQKMVIPMGTQFISYKGESYLNTWYNDMIDGDLSNIGLGKGVLLMCYAALCNGLVDRNKLREESERIYNMVITNDYDSLEFRFFMNWLAAIVQFPGINLQTNLWLIGPIQGLGKGTIVDIIRLILGSEFVGELNQLEIEAGWNDHLVGLQLVEVNEFDTDDKGGRGWSGKKWGKWIKGHTIEPTLKIRERNRTSYNVLNIGNYFGTSNTVEQTFVDSNDRRNQFIRTTNDEYWVQYATALQIKQFKVKPKEVASGFAYILEQVKVDLDFIGKAHKNDFKNEIASNNKTDVEQWFENDPTIIKDKWQNAANMYEDFKNWYRTGNPSAQIPTITAWGREMNSAEHIGARKSRIASGVQRMFTSNIIKQAEHKLTDSVNDLNTVTGDTGEIVVYDLDVVVTETNASMLTPLEKMRAALRVMTE